jgi:hypothetical protein
MWVRRRVNRLNHSRERRQREEMTVSSVEAEVE